MITHRISDVFVFMIVCAAAGVAAAQQDDEPGKAEVKQPIAADQEAPSNNDAQPQAPLNEPSARRGAWDLLRASGSIGVVIILLSIAATALVLEHVVTIRRAALIPNGLAQELHELISTNSFAQAERLCKLKPSYLGYVVLAGLQEVSIGFASVEKSMEDASQEQAARLFRKVEYLALIGNVAPMLGLLGTVYGLVLAFKRVAETQGTALAADLADGIYLALITTVMGLVVAIPALSAYAIFRSRIEQLASEVNVIAEHTFLNYKRSRASQEHAAQRVVYD